MPECDPHLDSLIDAAFDSYPLAPLPPRFTRRTMAHIFPRPRFRLEFLDLALPVFTTIFFISMTGLGVWLINFLNPFWLLELQAWAHWSAQNMSTFPWSLAAAVSIVVTGVCVLIGLAFLLVFDKLPSWRTLS
jgi:hypothetical protein